MMAKGRRKRHFVSTLLIVDAESDTLTRTSDSPDTEFGAIDGSIKPGRTNVAENRIAKVNMESFGAQRLLWVQPKPVWETAKAVGRHCSV
ncbi:uncharacterized protein PHALS_14603 [Plasmopara halstedii]|uniref:Uncharacterized protein n=1 Tax=Plasmopara halstedii TaxID=4781 RepID=A0A0P1AMD1_PLAHL|nr:uncharacterized protein PHALS_14603 [Plasmopara halstedii]CEG42215.1 hypothetical protein PHALS_14603 [Plasmopara halstedii]|eukprot:XP_024578584.1 hypothetical protein PHALS_14603 [Plasmopara halstedii]